MFDLKICINVYYKKGNEMNKKIKNVLKPLECIALPVPNYNEICISKPSCKNIINQDYCGTFCIKPKEQTEVEIWKTNIIVDLLGITLTNETKEKMIVYILCDQLEILNVLPEQSIIFTGKNAKSVKIITTENKLNILEGKYYIQVTCLF